MANDAQQSHVGRHTCTNKHGCRNSHEHHGLQRPLHTWSDLRHTLHQNPQSAHCAHTDRLREANSKKKKNASRLRRQHNQNIIRSTPAPSLTSILITACTTSSSTCSPLTRRISRLPAAFNGKSPWDCGCCRQPPTSASWRLCRHTHEPDARRCRGRWEENQRREKRRKNGEFKKKPGGKRRAGGCALLSSVLL